jgi:N6-adenosine-specific RNA methylase IME4
MVEQSIVRQGEKGVTLGLPGDWTPTAWIAPEGLQFEDWKAIGPILRDMEGAVHWWIGDYFNYGSRQWGKMYDAVAEATGFAAETIRVDRWVAERIKNVARATDLTWAHHKVVAALGPEEQEYWLSRAKENDWAARELRRQIRKAQPTPELPTDRYHVLYADPPWEYPATIPPKYGPAESHYPTMPTEEICAMGDDITAITTDEAVLFLWCTAAKIEDALSVLTAWGFRYTGAHFIWDKIRHNWGHYNSVRHELLLIGTKGSCLPEEEQLFDSVQTIERTGEHSQKPEEFRKIIDTLYPRGKRLELFARRAAENWDVWGNEAP